MESIPFVDDAPTVNLRANNAARLAGAICLFADRGAKLVRNGYLKMRETNSVAELIVIFLDASHDVRSLGLVPDRCLPRIRLGILGSPFTHEPSVRIE